MNLKQKHFAFRCIDGNSSCVKNHQKLDLLHKIQSNLIYILCISSLSSFAHADAALEFYVRIDEPTCEILKLQHQNGGLPNDNIDLGTRSALTLSKVGNRTPTVLFPILVRNCKPNINVQISMKGTAHEADQRYLKLSNDPGVAKNVAIQITQESGATFPINKKSNEYKINQYGERGLVFGANYIAVGPGPATGGVANGVLTLAVDYE